MMRKKRSRFNSQVVQVKISGSLHLVKRVEEILEGKLQLVMSSPVLRNDQDEGHHQFIVLMEAPK